MNSQAVALQLTEQGFCKYNLFSSQKFTPNQSEVERLVDSYPSMALDPYSSGNRLRAYIQVRVNGEVLTFGKFEAYQQSLKYNPVTGGTVRDYPSIDPHILASEVFQRMLLQDIEVVRAIRGIPAPELLMIGVHLFRYRAGQRPAYSSPAWLHRDDENIVFVHLIDRSPELIGGDNVIAKNAREIDRVIRLEQRWDTLLVDHQCLHAVTPMAAPEWFREHEYVHRDVILVTFQSREETASA